MTDKDDEIRKLRAELREIREEPELVRKAYTIARIMKQQKEAEQGEVIHIADVYKLKGYCKGEKEEEKMGGTRTYLERMRQEWGRREGGRARTRIECKCRLRRRENGNKQPVKYVSDKCVLLS